MDLKNLRAYWSRRCWREGRLPQYKVLDYDIPLGKGTWALSCQRT